MLIICSECGEKISDKAISCPHCGFPMRAGSKQSEKNNTRSHLRLPNGFGRITKLSDPRLRKPYRVMVSVGKDVNGRPIAKTLKPQAYFKTYKEAYEALLEYHKDPSVITRENLTCKEVFDRWLEQHYTDESKSSKLNAVTVWRYCHPLYDLPIANIKTHHIRMLLEDAYVMKKGKKVEATPILKSKIKSVWNMLLDYALEYDLVTSNVARNVKLPKKISTQSVSARKGHMSFDADEMNKLWAAASSDPFVRMLLVQCYSGWRPQELLTLKRSAVDLENWTFTGGLKTEAGKNRTVPIHSAIRGFVSMAMKDGDPNIDALFQNKWGGTYRSIVYATYKPNFNRIMKTLGLKEGHRPHDGRKQFVTMAKNSKMDEYAIKRIVGHAVDDITEKVYTDRDPSWLAEEIEKIKTKYIIYI